MVWTDDEWTPIHSRFKGDNLPQDGQSCRKWFLKAIVNVVTTVLKQREVIDCVTES